MANNQNFMTRIKFLYRDASNYKVHNSCVVKGEMTTEQAETIELCLYQGEFFIPEQVGLPVERFSAVTEDDHPWCELEKGYFYEPVTYPSMTEEVLDMNVSELVDAFVAAANEWDASALT